MRKAFDLWIIQKIIHFIRKIHLSISAFLIWINLKKYEMFGHLTYSPDFSLTDFISKQIFFYVYFSLRFLLISEFMLKIQFSFLSDNLKYLRNSVILRHIDHHNPIRDKQYWFNWQLYQYCTKLKCDRSSVISYSDAAAPTTLTQLNSIHWAIHHQTLAIQLSVPRNYRL